MLDRIEHLLALPIDSFAAKGLRKEREEAWVTTLKGVIHIT